MNAVDMQFCTKCKKSFEDLKIIVKQNVEALRKTESGSWENIANMQITSNEVLCKDCFDQFVDSLSASMNR
jgi:hypothetical protein